MGGRIGRSERWLVLAAMVLAVAASLAFALARRHHPLLGDAIEYDLEGRFISQGHWWWSQAPYGIPHASAWKAPVYPAFVGILYSVLGDHAVRVEVVQALVFAPLTVALTWWLGRRLVGPRAGIAAAVIVAIYPAVWQWHGLLYTETLAIPLTLLLLIAVLGRVPTLARAAGAGALLGLSLLVRPSSIFLLAGIVVAWLLAAGIRRGLAFSALSVIVAMLVVAPWTIRNAVVLHGFLPVSIQDAAAYGTFNSDSANDPVLPYAWRPQPSSVASFYDRRRPLPDLAFRSKLEDLATDYIKKHPGSVAEAFFWNGLSRTWDVRRPARVLREPGFDGRSKVATAVGLGMWWVLLALAVAGIWRSRRRARLVLPLLAMALAASVVFTSVAATRYRITLEPLLVILACSSVPWLARAREGSAQALERAAGA